MSKHLLLGLILVGCTNPVEQNPQLAATKYDSTIEGVIWNPCNSSIVTITEDIFKQVTGGGNTAHVRYVITFNGTDEQGNTYSGSILDNFTVNQNIARQHEVVKITTPTPGLSFNLEVAWENERTNFVRATCE